MKIPLRSRFTWVVAAGIALLLAAAALYFARSRHIDALTHQWVVDALSERFHAEVELASLHVQIFPKMRVTGEGLALYFRGRRDVPPLIHVRRFAFQLDLAAIFRNPRHVRRVFLDELVISIPPHDDRAQKAEIAAGAPSASERVPWPNVDEIECEDAHIILIPKKAGKEPLDWEIHNLTLHSVDIDKPFSFAGTLTNAKPKGEIATQGEFGPWNADDPGATPVSGAYKFRDADLGPFAGIAGTLSSDGKYAGALNRLAVDGETDMPNFSLDPVGTPVPLHTDYSATVDGTSGDTILHPVHAILAKSVVVAQGSVVKVPGQGHLTSLDVTAPNARIEDFLALAMNSPTPFLRGPVSVKAKLTIPPGKESMLDKIALDSAFDVKNARWGDAAVREKLEALSRRAEGQPENEDAGSSVSNLRGRFVMKRGLITFSKLTFSVPGAAVDLTGTYDMRSGNMDLAGHLTMQARISQTTTGVKSFFLKAIDPFFAKNGAGAVIPIRITGDREQPKFSLAFFGGGKKDAEDDKEKKGDERPKKN